ncbi:hypothetical protein HY214_00170 [Candidatus Roizmanbacteria bacterium]|nr:hypothetical protein [Candidatus Roizmanbacteria bacterium]
MVEPADTGLNTRLAELGQGPGPFFSFKVGDGIVKIGIPESDSLNTQEEQRQESLVQSIVTSHYQRFSDEMGIIPTGELIIGRASRIGVTPLSPGVSLIGSMVGNLVDIFFSRAGLEEYHKETIAAYCREIVHHIHWTRVARAGEYPYIKTKAGEVLSEIIAGHPAQRANSDVHDCNTNDILKTPINYSLIQTLNNADLRYLLVTAFDDLAVAGEDAYELARYLLPSIREIPWKHKKLVAHSITPNTASTDRSVVERAKIVAQRLKERTSFTSQRKILITPNDINELHLNNIKSEAEFVDELRKIRERQYSKLTEKDRVELKTMDKESMKEISAIREQIMDKGLGLNDRFVSRLSELASYIFSQQYID